MGKISLPGWIASYTDMQPLARLGELQSGPNYYVVSAPPKTFEKIDNMLLFHKILDILNKK